MISGETRDEGFLKKLGALVKRSCTEFALPLLQRPMRLQTAALCYRKHGEGRQILLITSRGTGRWILPKGWLMRGMNASEAAAVEAWEEAGVRGRRTSERPLGTYTYDKITGRGLPVRVETLVFPIEVRSLADDFLEAGQRHRQWVDPAEAADMVAEPGLKKILLDFAETADA